MRTRKHKHRATGKHSLGKHRATGKHSLGKHRATGKHSLGKGKHSLGKHRATGKHSLGKGKHSLGKHRTRKVYKGGATKEDLINQILFLQDFRNKQILKINFFNDLIFFKKSLPPLDKSSKLMTLINKLIASEIKVKEDTRYANRDLYLQEILNELLKTPQSTSAARKTHKKKRESPNKFGSPKDAGENWILYDAGGEGNCFYYSLFEALNNYNGGSIVPEILGSPKDKNDFNKDYRKYIKTILVNPVTPEEIKIIHAFICNLLADLKKYNKGKIIITQAELVRFCNFYRYEPAVVTLFLNNPEFKPYYISRTETDCDSIDINLFSHVLIQLGNLIATTNLPAGPLETLLTYEFLKQSNISLKILYDNPNGNLPIIEIAGFGINENVGFKIIYLKSITYSSGHFQWFKVADAP